MSFEEERTNHGVTERKYHKGLPAKEIADNEPGGYGDSEAIKLQSFVRGALCRARVSLMVKNLIDNLLAERTSAVAAAEVQSTGQSKTEQAGDSGATAVRATESTGLVEEDEEAKGDTKNEAVATSMQDASETDSNAKEMENTEDLQKSVSDILSKFEAKADLSATSRVRHWSPVKGTKSPMKAGTEQKSSLPGVPYAPSDPKSVREKKFEHNSTRHVLSSEDIVHQHEERLEEEMRQLLKDIRRVGEPGKPSVTFGDLFEDDQVANYYEALVGTLKAAKKKGLVKYQGQVLLKGISDNVMISITSFEG